MANKSKETRHLVENIETLAKQSYNESRISKCVGISRETVRKIAKKHGIAIIARVAPDTIRKTEHFISLIKSGKTITEARKESGVSCQGAQDIINKHSLRSLVRTRAEASLDKTLSLEEAAARLPSNAGTVLRYDPEKKKYEIRAPDGFVYYKSSAKLYQGDPRNKCGVKLSENVVANRLKELGYELVPGTFSINRMPLKATHLACGTIREARLKNFELQGCPRCSNVGVSKEEAEVADYVRFLGFVVEKYKFEERVTRPKEIDIYVSEKKIGIEYCGLYFHGERSGKDRNYHKKKMDMAAKEGVQLLTVFSHEWNTRKEQVKGFIMSKLGKNQVTVFARKTEIRKLDQKIAREFLESYHMQGATRVQVAFGLFLGGELLAVVSGSEHHRIGGQFSLNRLCFKPGVTVVGGSSKLNKALVGWARSSG